MSDIRPLKEIARLMYARQEYHLGCHIEHWSREFEKLEAENKRMRRLAGFHLDAQITEALSVMELKQQLAASAKQYQEACDDAHKFAVDNEQLRKALETAWSHIPQAQLKISHCKDYAVITEALGSSGSAVPNHFVDANKMVAPAKPGKTTRLYGYAFANVPEHTRLIFERWHCDTDTHYIDIAEDGAIVGGKLENK